MIGNPWSGGGKVESFGLEALADELGVEVVMLAEGLDLEQLARNAVARGADVIGMATRTVASTAHRAQRLILPRTG